MTQIITQHVFIVEDNALNLKLFRDLLEVAGVSVSAASSGIKAVEEIEACIPDLIIMDIQLEAVSGIDLIKQIKATPKISNIPIIAITAFAMHADREHILQAGCEAYLSKPFNIDEFYSALKTYIPLPNIN
jgi:two-component system cell cycle response regulator DivK